MKRGRGRGGRKPSNNLNRTLESNGPDVKVRGTAHQICDKYQALARDAHASGDRIAYENYLQHAEHYHRIIAAAQQSSQEANAGARSRDEDADKAEKTDKAEETASADAEAADAKANGDGNGDDDSSAEAPRRARRGRRPRTTRGKTNGSGDEASSDDNEATAETA